MSYIDDSITMGPLGNGGKRPGAGRKAGTVLVKKDGRGRPKGSTKPGAEEQADSYARLAKAKADHEEHKAAIAEMDRRKREGELIESSEVDAAWQDIAARVKAKLLAVPGKVAPIILEAESVEEADTIIKSAIYEALRELNPSPS